MEIRPDVHWLEGRASNLYLCVEADGLTLIDAGMPNEQKLVLAAVRVLGRKPADLTRIIITHADVDHAGSLAALHAATGATVYAGMETADFLTRGATPRHMPGLIQFFVNRFVKYPPTPAAAIRPLAEGDELPVLGGLRVLATPGHTPEHFALYSPGTGVLFAGDALNTRNGRLQRTPGFVTADAQAANRSAIRLLELAPAVFAGGHGAPLRDHDADDLMRLFGQLR